MPLVWAIGLMVLVAWAIGVVMVPQFEPWIHAPLLLVAIAFGYLAFGPRRRKRREP